MRRTTPPFVILIVGAAAVIVFAWGLSNFGDTPALKLKPELDKKFATKGFRTRYIGGDEPYVEIEAPASVAKHRSTSRPFPSSRKARCAVSSPSRCRVSRSSSSSAKRRSRRR